jgi:hypothetical protein
MGLIMAKKSTKEIASIVPTRPSAPRPTRRPGSGINLIRMLNKKRGKDGRFA